MLDLLDDDPDDVWKAKIAPKEWVVSSDDHERFMKSMRGTAEVVSATAQAFLAALKDRFPPNETLEAFNILSPEFFLDENAENLLIDSTMTLAKQFACVSCRPGQCSCASPLKNYLLKREMEDFMRICKHKSETYSRRCDKDEGGPLHFLNWLLENGLLQSTCPEYVKLLKIIVTVPLTTVENERRFAHMNLTKTDNRSRLDEIHLNACLRLKHVPQELWTIGEFKKEICIPAYRELSQSNTKTESSSLSFGTDDDSLPDHAL
ncbi:hypothetical protein M9434_002499 [Picochlorum sp. BPE23]|nr:hypothetical protein M9434_002499 [Picochlorum sp. BPE23]